MLRKAKLFEEAVETRRQTEALQQIMVIMSSEVAPEMMMQRMMEASYTLVKAERMTLYSVDLETGECIARVTKDIAFRYR